MPFMAKSAGETVSILLIILAIDAFRTLFESAYFGLYFNSMFGILPKNIYNTLSQPALLIIPKVINVFAGLLVLFLLIRHWMPKEMAERQRVESALRESEEQHRSILYTAMDGFWRVDMQGRLLEVNTSYCRMSGYSEGELLSMSIPDLEDIETLADTAARIKKIAESGEARFESRHRRKDGSSFAVQVNVQYKPENGGNMVVFIADITESKKYQEKLDHMAHFDMLTGLPNRALFIDRFQQAMAQSKRTGSQLAICFLDLDNFKPINDGHGHNVGDQILIEGRVGKRNHPSSLSQNRT